MENDSSGSIRSRQNGERDHIGLVGMMGMGDKKKAMVLYGAGPQVSTWSKWGRLGSFKIVFLAMFAVSFYIYGQEIKPDAVADSLNALGQWAWWQIVLISLCGYVPYLIYKYVMKKLDKKNGNGKTAPTPPNGQIALHQIDERIKAAAKGFNTRMDDLRQDFTESLTSIREIRDNQETNTKSINDLRVDMAKGVGESKRNDGKQFQAIKNIELKLFGSVITSDDDDKTNG